LVNRSALYAPARAQVVLARPLSKPVITAQVIGTSKAAPSRRRFLIREHAPSELGPCPAQHAVDLTLKTDWVHHGADITT
jgi:hypothetical protein